MHSFMTESVLYILRIRAGFQQHGGVRLPEAVKITVDAELLLDHGDRVLHRLDLALGAHYIRDAVIIGFMANELISIVENAGLMGIPLPGAITSAVEVLTEKANSTNEFHKN